MDCICENKPDTAFKAKLHAMHHDLVDGAKRVLRSAADPVSGVLSFLQERPEGTSLAGHAMNYVLLEAFEDESKIPGLVRILAGHVKEISRHANIIDIVNSHAAVEKWDHYLIKLKEQIKFEIRHDRGAMLMDNIVGLTAVEHGVELPVELIKIQPPNLIVTLKLGPLHPKRVLSI
jgi:hypothetical protein